MKFLFSVLAAFVLEIIPLPFWFSPMRPEFLLIVLIYWVLAMPYRIGVGTAWLLGLVADLLHGNLLGERALITSLIVFLVIKFHPRIRLFPLRQQVLSVFLFTLLFQCIEILISCAGGSNMPSYGYWLAPFTTALGWPLLPYLLGSYLAQSERNA